MSLACSGASGKSEACPGLVEAKHVHGDHGDHGDMGFRGKERRGTMDMDGHGDQWAPSHARPRSKVNGLTCYAERERTEGTRFL